MSVRGMVQNMNDKGMEHNIAAQTMTMGMTSHKDMSPPQSRLMAARWNPIFGNPFDKVQEFQPDFEKCIILISLFVLAL